MLPLWIQLTLFSKFLTFSRVSLSIEKCHITSKKRVARDVGRRPKQNLTFVLFTYLAISIQWLLSDRKDSHHQREKGKCWLNIFKAFEWYVNDASICSCQQNLGTSNLIKRLKFIGLALAHTIPSQPWSSVSAGRDYCALMQWDCQSALRQGRACGSYRWLLRTLTGDIFSHHTVAKMSQYRHQHSHKDQKKLLVWLLIAFGDFSCQRGWKAAKSSNKVGKLATLV